MSNKIKAVIAIVMVALCTWFYFTPHLAIREMRAAAEAKDAVKLAGYVDFPALRENLKASFNAKMTSEMAAGSGSNPLGVLGAIFAAKIVDPMIDALITPESLFLLMKGSKPKAIDLQHQDTATTTESQSDKPETTTTSAYESFDRFVVTVNKNGSIEHSVGLVFMRNGLFSWKLSALRLPLS
ncbi:DUF2939 domain-containing protein [Chitinivorax sp. B]|uniref:DUF2939 domain-containing protein n=1 Tax=Chitinivorax sp. B TaxID=2502235 RepID=UPI0010FA4174|nr:DUF2939 domain-containing protein [Chitinivorax sp. B]